MRLSNCLRHPAAYLRRAAYYLIGNTVGRAFYPPPVYKSRWFSDLGAAGWEWITKGVIHQKLGGTNSKAWWPVSRLQRVSHPCNISFHVDDLNNFQMPGTYFQSLGHISIGRGTYIAQNVGIITANHDPADLNRHTDPRPVAIGERCWIGMNSVILPGVTLGDNTVVGAGSVVTRSFADGHCVIAGNPAKVIRLLPR